MIVEWEAILDNAALAEGHAGNCALMGKRPRPCTCDQYKRTRARQARAMVDAVEAALFAAAQVYGSQLGSAHLAAAREGILAARAAAARTATRRADAA